MKETKQVSPFLIQVKVFTKLLEYIQNSIDQPIWRIVLEPSGGYETALLTELTLGHYPVSLVHAKRIRDFAKAIGLLEKSDKLDAKILAHYGSLLSPDIVSSSSLEHKELKALVLRRRCLIEEGLFVLLQ